MKMKRYQFNPVALTARLWRVRRGRRLLALGGTVRRVR
jgi:hypothetical protein